jgi:RNA polymerase sigma-B factor
VTSASGELNTRLGRPPSTAELAKETGLGQEQVVEAIAAASAYEAESLDTRQASNGDEREPLVATLPSVEGGYDLVEYGVSMRPAMAELSDQERAILAMRFFEDLTQSEIARRIGISQMQVSRVLRRAVDHLHKATQAAA